MQSGTCKHFNGANKRLCRAGVNYRELVGGDDFGWVRRLPCKFKDSTGIVCPQYDDPTNAEIEESKRGIRAAIDRLVVADRTIAAFKQRNKGKSTKEVVKCPCCDGELHMSISSYNEHTRGKCETDGCLEWVE